MPKAKPDAPVMRAKMVVYDVATDGKTETLALRAVAKTDGYPNDGADEDNTFARWTPTASLGMQITNPDLVGQFQVGDTFYLDFTRVEA